MAEHKEKLLEIYLQEYGKLKDEQKSRIGFRDNLLYVTLGLFGGILSFAVSKQDNYYALLVLPWVCLILGWTYLVNDEKVTAIGQYIRKNLCGKIASLIDCEDSDSIVGWEIVHRNDERRGRRKLEQLIIDQITFVVSGMAVLIAFWFLVPQSHWAVKSFSLIEFALLIVLSIEISIYAKAADTR